MVKPKVSSEILIPPVGFDKIGVLLWYGISYGQIWSVCI